MQDRFKFRIPMFTDKGSFMEFQYIELGEQEECTLCGYNGEPQECTGLKDKNGKIIYVGDILCNPFSNYRYVVNFGKFTLNYTKPFSVNIIGFYITYKENTKNEIDSLQMLDLTNIKIIGNIHQNPELLEE